jgi:ABC-type amino acid transport system permease subunit
VIVAVSGLGGLAIGVVSAVIRLVGVPAVGNVVAAVFNAVLSTCVLAIIAAAYLQLVDDEADDDEYSEHPHVAVGDSPSLN